MTSSKVFVLTGEARASLAKACLIFSNLHTNECTAHDQNLTPQRKSKPLYLYLSKQFSTRNIAAKTFSISQNSTRLFSRKIMVFL